MGCLNYQTMHMRTLYKHKTSLLITMGAFILKSTEPGRACSTLASGAKLRDRLRGGRFMNKSEDVLA